MTGATAGRWLWPAAAITALLVHAIVLLGAWDQVLLPKGGAEAGGTITIDLGSLSRSGTVALMPEAVSSAALSAAPSEAADSARAVAPYRMVAPDRASDAVEAPDPSQFAAPPLAAAQDPARNQIAVPAAQPLAAGNADPARLPTPPTEAALRDTGGAAAPPLPLSPPVTARAVPENADASAAVPDDTADDTPVPLPRRRPPELMHDDQAPPVDPRRAPARSAPPAAETAPTSSSETSVDPAPDAAGMAGGQDSVPSAAGDPAVDAQLLADYLGRVRSILERHKRYPARAQALRQGGVVLLWVRLDRQGGVRDWSIATSSGHPALDREAAAMLQRADPLPAFPAGIAAAYLDLEVPIRFQP